METSRRFAAQPREHGGGTAHSFVEILRTQWSQNMLEPPSSWCTCRAAEQSPTFEQAAESGKRSCRYALCSCAFARCGWSGSAQIRLNAITVIIHIVFVPGVTALIESPCRLAKYFLTRTRWWLLFVGCGSFGGSVTQPPFF